MLVMALLRFEIVHAQRPIALAPFAIRWERDASSDVPRRAGRCIVCGHKGATLRYPSWRNHVVGV
jgi:hypothetical protein